MMIVVFRFVVLFSRCRKLTLTADIGREVLTGKRGAKKIMSTLLSALIFGAAVLY